MKVFIAPVLFVAFLLVLNPLGPAERAAAEVPAVTEVISAADLNLFLGTNPGCYTLANDFFGVVSDPSLDYDAANDRFMLSMIGFDQLFFTSSLCIAVTETGDPTGNWFIYAFPVSPFSSLL